MYSDMSTWIIASSSPNRNSASVRASSVLPTPDGPRKMNEPVGPLRILDARRGRGGSTSRRDDRLFLADDALVQLLLHADEPADSASVSLKTGMPVHIETMSAISSSPTCGCSSVLGELRHCSSSSRFFCVSLRSLSRREAAFSNSWFSIELPSPCGRARSRPRARGSAAGGHRLDAQPRGGLVDQVDRLVGQVAVLDVAVGELGRGLERLVGDR
jgi:Protein of unknown function (DUF3170).